MEIDLSKLPKEKLLQIASRLQVADGSWQEDAQPSGLPNKAVKHWIKVEFLPAKDAWQCSLHWWEGKRVRVARVLNEDPAAGLQELDRQAEEGGWLDG